MKPYYDGTERLTVTQRRALLALFLVIAGPPFLFGFVLGVLVMEIAS